MAASLQVVFEDAAFHVLNGLHAETKLPRLCLAGGCAMNSVANGKIRERTPFTDVYIQPASGDNGTALGAAYYVWNQVLGQPRRFVMSHGYWGPAFANGPDRRCAGRTRRRPRACRLPGARHRRRRGAGRLDRRPALPTGRWSAGSRAAWNGARARSATAASWPIRAAPTCARSSTRRSSFARSSGRSRQAFSKNRTRSTSSTPSPIRS